MVDVVSWAFNTAAGVPFTTHAAGVLRFMITEIDHVTRLVWLQRAFNVPNQP